MAIQTLKDTGPEHIITSSMDGAIYRLGTVDCVCKDVGDQFTLHYEAGNLNVTFNAGSQACICGNLFFMKSPTVVTLAANSTIYLCARIDTTKASGQTGSFEQCTDSNMYKENINGTGTKCDLLLYVITTNDSGIASVQDRRKILESALGEAGQTGPCIRVLAPNGSTVTVSNGTTEYSAVVAENNRYDFYLNKRGTWTVTYGTSTETVTFTENKDVEINFMSVTMGISRDTTSSSPLLTRTGSAAGKTATASIGSTAGSSDFDTMPIYKDIEKITLATGDVMVKIPKFYYKRHMDGNNDCEEICTVAQTGFSVHPVFKRGSTEYDYFYVGAYKTSSNNKSISGAAPQVSQTRATFRSNARSKGAGWGIIDVAARSAINLLIKIEFGTLDVQTAIGAGCSAKSAATNTGSCDGVPNLTGRPAGSSDQVDVVWRGIEGLWGNVWEWTDGLNFNNGAYYVCNVPDSYADDTSSGYEILSYSGATNWSSSYIKTMGFDGSHPHVLMPTAVGGSETTYFCDGVWSSTGWRVLFCGGYWYSGSVCGVSACDVSAGSSGTSAYRGSRLLYMPQ